MEHTALFRNANKVLHLVEKLSNSEKTIMQCSVENDKLTILKNIKINKMLNLKILDNSNGKIDSDFSKLSEKNSNISINSLQNHKRKMVDNDEDGTNVKKTKLENLPIKTTTLSMESNSSETTEGINNGEKSGHRNDRKKRKSKLIDSVFEDSNISKKRKN